LQNSSVFISDLDVIAAKAVERAEENDHFLRSLRTLDAGDLDATAHEVNSEVTAAIDCTECGNCCSKLVINVTKPEVAGLAETLGISELKTRELYIEESMGGNCFVNTIPCHFLSDKKCTIYTDRFTECRDFPHLHKPGFKARLAGTLNYYGSCPIIYNVVEVMKRKVGFLDP
jgi:Fe-S-cluster containining protein